MGSGWYVSGEDGWAIEGWERPHGGGAGCGAGEPVRIRGRARGRERDCEREREREAERKRESVTGKNEHIEQERQSEK